MFNSTKTIDTTVKTIIPCTCTKPMFARFTGDGETAKKPIVCFALMQYSESGKVLTEDVIPMCINESGEVFNPTECVDFTSIEY